MVEQHIRNVRAVSSNLIVGSLFEKIIFKTAFESPIGLQIPRIPGRETGDQH